MSLYNFTQRERQFYRIQLNINYKYIKNIV